MPSHRAWWYAVIPLALVAIAALIVPEPGGSLAAGPARQAITIATGLVPRNFDPKNTTALADYNFLRLVYDTLVSADSGRPEPWAAESWQALDAKHWRFQLRRGITFSDGEPLDAAAVKFTLERVLQDPKAPWRARVEMIREIRPVDAYTVDFLLNSPVGDLPTRLAIVWIVPPKYTQETGLGTAPVGTGPFTVEEYTPAQSLTLRAKKNYWKGALKLEEVRFRPIAEPSTRVAALLAGDADIAYLILPEQIEQVKGHGFEVISRPTAQSANLFFQASRETPVANVKVRQAIDFALPKRAIFQAITSGLGRYLDGQLVGPRSAGYNPNVHARPYDPQRARQLLKEAGFPNGFEIGFDYSVGRYFRDKEIAEAIAGYLRQVGIRPRLNPMSGGAWLDRLYSGTWGSLNYWSIQDAPAYDLAFTMDIFRSTNNRRITADKNLDGMLDESYALTDPQQRNVYLRKFAQYLFDQAYFVAFHQDPGLYGVSPRVKNVEFLPSTYVQLLGAYVGQ